MTRAAAVALVSLALAGCAELEAELATLTASPQELHQQRLDEARQDCAAYGWTPGTPEFAQCMQDVHTQDSARRAALGAAYMQSRQRQSQPVFTPLQTRPTTTTTCSPIGNSVSCTSR